MCACDPSRAVVCASCSAVDAWDYLVEFVPSPRELELERVERDRAQRPEDVPDAA